MKKKNGNKIDENEFQFVEILKATQSEAEPPQEFKESIRPGTKIVSQIVSHGEDNSNE